MKPSKFSVGSRTRVGSEFQTGDSETTSCRRLAERRRYRLASCNVRRRRAVGCEILGAMPCSYPWCYSGLGSVCGRSRRLSVAHICRCLSLCYTCNVRIYFIITRRISNSVWMPALVSLCCSDVLIAGTEGRKSYAFFSVSVACTDSPFYA